MKNRNVLFVCIILILTGILGSGCSKNAPVAAVSLAPVQTSAASSAPSTPIQSSTTPSIEDLINKANLVQSMTLDFIVTSPDGKVTSGTIWGLNSQKLKIQTTVKGVVYILLYNFTNDTVITYSPAEKKGTKTKQPADSPVPESPDSYLKDLASTNVKDLGTEVINGDNCRVIQFVGVKKTNVTYKMWLSENLGFPLQITSTTTEGKTTKIDYTNLQVGTLPSGIFDVPAGVAIKDSTKK